MKHYLKYLFSKKYRTQYKILKLVSQITFDAILCQELVNHTNRMVEAALNGDRDIIFLIHKEEIMLSKLNDSVKSTIKQVKLCLN